MNIYLKIAVSLIAFKALFTVIMLVKCKNYNYVTFIGDISFLCALAWMIYLYSLVQNQTESLVYHIPYVF